MTLSLALIGCGGMGRRHIGGMRQLHRIGKLPFELAAVCDLYASSAQSAADLAADVLGKRPTVHTSLDQLRGIDAVILTTSPETHAPLGIAAMEMGHARADRKTDDPHRRPGSRSDRRGQAHQLYPRRRRKLSLGPDQPPGQSAD